MLQSSDVMRNLTFLDDARFKSGCVERERESEREREKERESDRERARAREREREGERERRVVSAVAGFELQTPEPKNHTLNPTQVLNS